MEGTTRLSDAPRFEAENLVLGAGTVLAKIGDEWLDQANRQISAAPNRPIIWYFNDEVAAEYAKRLFSKANNSPLKRIHVVYLPMNGLIDE